MVVVNNQSNVKLISVGDRFPQARCNRIDSVFDQVINFKYSNKIVSVVQPEIGSGPFKIVIDGLKPEIIKTIELTKDAVILNDEIIISYTKEQIYDSQIDFSMVDLDKLATKISLLKTMISLVNHPSAITYLLNEEEDKTALSPFEQELGKQFKEAYKHLLNNEFEQAAQGFRGRGFGLTPAGDDFNAGLLLGLLVRQETEKKELSKIRSCIYHISLGKNLLVNTFLHHAHRGWFDEKWKKMVLALMAKPDELEREFQGVLKQGETSGADTLTGFLSAWEIKI